MSSEHRFSKEGETIGLSQRVKKGKNNVCIAMLYTANWKPPHCLTSLLPGSSQTLPITFHNEQNYCNIALLLDSSSIVSLVMHLCEVVMK